MQICIQRKMSVCALCSGSCNTHDKSPWLLLIERGILSHSLAINCSITSSLFLWHLIVSFIHPFNFVLFDIGIDIILLLVHNVSSNYCAKCSFCNYTSSFYCTWVACELARERCCWWWWWVWVEKKCLYCVFLLLTNL